MRTCKDCKWYSFCRKWYSFFRGMGYPERMKPCDCFEMKKTCEDCKWYSKRDYHLHDEFACVFRGVINPECIKPCKNFERNQVFEIKRTCEDCKWFGGYTGEKGVAVQTYFCDNPVSAIKYRHYNPKNICKRFEERKTMVESKTLQEAYKIMQAAWVELYDVEVGDTVKIIRDTKNNELGSLHGYCDWMTGKECQVSSIGNNYIGLERAGYFPFFCLEVVKKAEPKIEVTCKINGETMPLSTLSEETILNIRKGSK